MLDIFNPVQLNPEEFRGQLRNLKKAILEFGPDEIHATFTPEGHFNVYIRQGDEKWDIIVYYIEIVYELMRLTRIEVGQCLKMIDMIDDDIYERGIVGFCRFNISTTIFHCTFLTEKHYAMYKSLSQ
ncbi:MAG TPA: hypothetical protein VD905_21530 [Flavobacteriales bacterium]|nr:hypothetical protein [Flavobacteriales bacterium]